MRTLGAAAVTLQPLSTSCRAPSLLFKGYDYDVPLYTLVDTNCFYTRLRSL